MEAEISEEIGAGRGERSAERTAHRNGYRPRPWETRVGEIELLVPRKRRGEAYFPSFLEPRRPASRRSSSVVMEAYVNGVSTRKVDRLVEQLGISRDEQGPRLGALPGARRARRGVPQPPLEGDYPLPLARRQAPQGQRPRPRALEGPGGRLRGPRDRPPRGDRDRHRRDRDRGLLDRVLPLASLSRPRGRPPLRLRPPRGPEGGDRPDPRLPLAALHGPLRPQHAGPLPAKRTRARRSRPARGLRRRRLSSRPSASSGDGDRAASAQPCPRSPSSSRPPRRTCSPSTASPRRTGRSCARTNPLERLNKEIGRRSDVVGIFPNDASAIRLSGALLIEQNDEWLVSRRYLSAESISLVLADQEID